MPESPKAPYTYARAGVDIARGHALIQAVRAAPAATRSRGSLPF